MDDRDEAIGLGEPSAQGDGDPGPAALVALPEVDGGGDPEFVIYVEQAGGLVPYLGRSAKRSRVFIGGIEHSHVAEHDGAWVYRAC